MQKAESEKGLRLLWMVRTWETRRVHANAWVQTDYTLDDTNDRDMPYNQT